MQTHTYTNTHTCRHTHTNMQTHTRTHMQTQTHTHTHTQTDESFSKQKLWQVFDFITTVLVHEGVWPQNIPAVEPHVLYNKELGLVQSWNVNNTTSDLFAGRRVSSACVSTRLSYRTSRLCSSVLSRNRTLYLHTWTSGTDGVRTAVLRFI